MVGLEPLMAIPELIPAILGCTTCKAKRRKCDEAKPNCSQCLRRKITCGGYSKELTWRHEGFENPLGPKPATGNKKEKKNKANATPLRKPKTASSCQLVEGANDAPVSGLQDDPASDNNCSSQPKGQDTSPSVYIPALENDYDTAGMEPDMDFDVFFSDMASIMAFPEDLTLDSQQFLGGEKTTVNPISCVNSDGEHDTSIAPDFIDLHHRASPPRARSRPFSTIHESSNFTIDSSGYFSLNLPKYGLSDWYHPLNVSEDSPETIATVFNHRIYEALCIVDNSTDNPWRQIVWPLAQKHLALYHAVAAMTCFNGLPQLRAEGFRHLETSMQKLSNCQQTDGPDSMPLEVTATTLLALAMAKTWYYPRSYNGIAHLRKARVLIQALSQNPPASEQTSASYTSPSMRFLMNTWMYMDVLTRLTSPFSDDNLENHDITVDYDSVTSTLTSDAKSDTNTHIDPLMGYNWTPSLVIEDLSCNSELQTTSESITSSFSDLYQTANAYKWATLLLLYQAVPELPSRFSHSDIARKILVFIATVLLSSKAVFFPIFPLMVAGCEAANAEDREWVKKRWRSLSTLNGSGIADRCLELTIEVWRRRDEYSTQTDESYAYSVSAGELRQVSNPVYTRNRGGLNFDNIANLHAHIQPSVKSEIHWLSVMEEWGWEVVLG
ncbi:fungal-specific transcription factor domain-containing protein [Aspergillus filifer]